MLVIISPAKILNFKTKSILSEFTMPEFLNDAAKLVKIVRQKTASELSELLEINSKLAQQNVERYFNWHKSFSLDNAKQAVLAYDGEVFRGLDAKSFSDAEFNYLQSHLRIISGLYGVLRPLDLIQPYRLEVSTKLETSKGNDIYSFWGDKITKTLNKAMLEVEKPQLFLNLTSGEYFKSINTKKLKAKVIDVEFYQYKNGEVSSAVIYIKRARGLMTRYVIQNKIDNVEDLKGFDYEGYWFSPQQSTENKLVFIK